MDNTLPTYRRLPDIPAKIFDIFASDTSDEARGAIVDEIRKRAKQLIADAEKQPAGRAAIMRAAAHAKLAFVAAAFEGVRHETF